MSRSERSRALYRLLEMPAIYDRIMRFLGGPAARQRFVDEFLQPHGSATLLDVGCGTGALLDHLPPGVVYTGFDSNPAYIEAAKRQHGGRGEFFCARAEDESAAGERTFGFIVAMALLHHLDDDAAHRLLDATARRLAPSGVFVSIDPTRHDGQRWMARLLVNCDRGRRVRSPEGYRRLVAAHFDEVEEWTITDLLPVPYSHYLAKGRSASAR